MNVLDQLPRTSIGRRASSLCSRFYWSAGGKTPPPQPSLAIKTYTHCAYFPLISHCPLESRGRLAENPEQMCLQLLQL